MTRAGPDTPVLAGPPSPSPARRRIRHPARWIAGAVLCVAVALAVVAATRPSVEAVTFDSPLEGHPAPLIAGTDFAGQHVSLSQYRGRYVVVNFFASWCPPCAHEMPSLVDFEFRQQRDPQGAAMISVAYDDPDASASQFARQWGTHWPTLPDPGGRIAVDYGVNAPPTTFLVGPTGDVLQAWVAPVSTRQLTRALAGARAGAAKAGGRSGAAAGTSGSSGSSGSAGGSVAAGGDPRG